MKLKSYLRGLGLGIIVTTIILVIAFNKRNKPMTDAQIMSRAYELGMVETTLYGNGDKTEPDTRETTVPSILDDITTAAPTIPEETTSLQPETTAPTEPETTESVTEPTTEPTTAALENETVTVVLENITSASMASTILYEAGIIDDVKSFNAYLTQQGWATRVSEGTFEFKKGMTYEEVGKIITRQK